MKKLHIKTLLIVNIIITSAILISTTLDSSFLIFLLGLVTLLLFYGFSRLKAFFVVINKFKLLFITLLFFQLFLRRDGTPLWEFYLLKVTDVGVFYAFNSLLRYLVILLSATMLAGASPYKMIQALRTWRLPEPIIIIVSFTLQFLRQLQVEFKILKQNLLKRNISFPKMPWKKRFELGGQLIVPVLGRLFSEIKYKVIAMELNGYGTNKKVVSYNYTGCGVIDYVFMLLTIFLIFLIIKL